MMESRYWRQEIRKDISWLRKNRNFKRWSEKRLVLYERKLMMVAFQIRSLLTRPKVSKKVGLQRVGAKSYPKIGSGPYSYLSSPVYDHFDFDKPQDADLSVMDICNQLIHYYTIFMSCETQGRFSAVFLHSDYKRNKELFEIDLSELIGVFSEFSKESSALGTDGTAVKFVWNNRKKDFVVEEETFSPADRREN